MEKDFKEWSSLKEKLDKTAKQILFKEREVWWCSLGINVGHEENGKNKYFTRPVLILRKFNRQIFLAVPLTSKLKDNKFYFKITFKEKEQSAMLSQIRVLEGKRLRNKMGEITEGQFDAVRKSVSEIVIFGG